MFLALIEPGGYLNFATPMPFADKSGPLEQGLLNQAGHISRRPQAAVRGLSQPVWPMKLRFCRARLSSEERRVGQECVSTCRSRWWPVTQIQKRLKLAYHTYSSKKIYPQ